MLYISFNYRELHRLKEAVFAPHMVNAGFEEYGPVKSVNLITDRQTGRPRGFGFVEMETGEEAEEAITRLDGKIIKKIHKTKPLKVRWPKPHEKGQQ